MGRVAHPRLSLECEALESLLPSHVGVVLKVELCSYAYHHCQGVLAVDVEVVYQSVGDCATRYTVHDCCLDHVVEVALEIVESIHNLVPLIRCRRF